MTVPIDYRRASADFDGFVLDLREALDLQTTHQAWGVLLGILSTFGRRLNSEESLIFAKALPPLLRSAFVQEWHIPNEPLPFVDREALEAEVMAYHRDHQLAQPGCIAATAATVWRHVDNERFATALRKLPAKAEEFWSSNDRISKA
jgi:uncharacterized protein (DUF2267 family)